MRNKFAWFALLALTQVGCDSIPLGGNAGAAGRAGAGGSSGASSSGGTGGARSTVARFKTNQFVAVRPSGSNADAGGNGGSTSMVGSGGNTAPSGASGIGGALFQCVPSGPIAVPPTSAVCGDGFRAATEDCDDNNLSDADSCSALCKVTPELVNPRQASTSVLPLPGRSLGGSRHPMAAGCSAVGVSFVDQSSTPPSLELSTYSSSGVPATTVRFGASTVDFPDPAVAALPGDAFALAWTDLGADGDELGIQLRRVDPNATAQSAAIVANDATTFSQSSPDVVFDGRELVVAWMDDSNPETAPDLRYRVFAPDLTPLSGDVTLAETNAAEGDVALAASNGNWAAAWRSGSAGMETIEVQSGTVHWTVGPFLPGLAGDRPDLTFLDDSHLALAFTQGTDPNGTGVANVSRLHGAMLDAAAPGTVASFAIPPAQNPYAGSPAIDQSQPSLAMFSDHLLVSWRSGAVPGDAKDSELWSRRIPFSVAPDHSLTIDPSHIEVPLVRTDAQRVGDQSAFRLLGTQLWPSGGLVAAWTDQGRSFQKAAGTPDVAVQFLPDLPEPPPAVTTYPLSADGKYYVVNVLRRNYHPPTVSAALANDAVIYNSVPQAVFDGDDSAFVWTTPAASDPDATTTMIVDMGQYLSIGAVRTLYNRTGQYSPVSHRIRLATIPGNWTTVLPMGAVTSIDATFSFDPTPARFLELTMLGTGATAAAALVELFVYPSAQASPPPTSANGYDLGYLATTSVNSNFFVPGVIWPMSWPAGDFYAKTLAQGATGDAVGTIDLGAQYAVSRLTLGFANNGYNWENGGRLELAGIPDTFSTLDDSGLGRPFAGDRKEYKFPAQPVRYIRATNYFTPGIGLSTGALWTLQAFGDPGPVTAYYPLSDDGKYFNVNLLRHSASTPQPVASVVYSNGAATRLTPANNVLDGDDLALRWQAPGLAGDPNPQVTLTIDLGQVQSVGAIRQWFNNPTALSFSLRAAQTLGSWTQVIADTPITTTSVTSSFDATQARYLELTEKGTLAMYGVVDFIELEVFPSSTSNPAPDSSGPYDHTYLPGTSLSVNANMNLQAATGCRIQQFFGSGKTVAQGATGDGVISIDLGQQYQVSHVGLEFLGYTVWSGGGKVEVDDGSGAWATVFDSGRGSVMGSPAGDLLNYEFPKRVVRYIRVTDYFVPGVGTSPGSILNAEVF